MQHQEGYLNNAAGDRLYHQTWLPEQQPRANLVLVHGLAEHCGRYMNLVNYFVPRGYAVFGLDQYGHGKSDGRRVYVDRFEEYTTSTKLHVDQIRSAHPGTPLFMVGHSMGGLIATVFLLDYQTDLQGAILSAPAVKTPENISPATIQVAKLLSTLFPKAGLVKLELDGLSRDRAVVQAYIDDPLVFTGKTTARLAAELLKATLRVQAEASKIRLPLLIVQGSADRLVDPRGAQELYEAVHSPDKTLHVYQDYYHEIFNEPEHKLVMADLETWLEAHLNSQ